MMRSLSGVAVLVGCLMATEVGAQYQLSLTDASGTPGTTVSVTAVLESTGVGVQGFSFGVCHDPSVLNFLDATPNPALMAPVIPNPLMLVDHGNGWTVAYVVSLSGLTTLPVGTVELIDAEYEILSPANSDLCFCDTLGSPPVQTVVIAEGSTFAPATVCGNISSGTFLMRGDASGDSIFDLGDVLVMLGVVFASATPPYCLDAADANDDGILDLADPIYSINYLFLGGPTPPGSVGGECGVDSTPSALGCESSACE